MSKESVSREENPEETGRRPPEGVSWKHPEEFPTFRGDAEKKLSKEEMEDRDLVVSSLHSDLSGLRYAEMPKGRKKPADEVFGEVYLAIEDMAASDDPEYITKAISEIGARIASLEREIRAEFNAEAQVLRDKVAELRGKDVPDGKFKFPDEVFDDLLKKIDDAVLGDPMMATRSLSEIEVDLRGLERLIGELDKEVGEKLWSLYTDPEISIGAHGTEGGKDTGFGTEDGPIMKYGIGCFYSDARRTVSFQDRGRIHAHGELSFLDLLTYSFGKKGGTVSELSIEKGSHFEFGKEVPASQYTVIVAIPESYSTTDLDLLMTEERIPVVIKNHVQGRPHKMARAIKPEFIVGIVQDGRVNDIVWNSIFNAEHIRELSREQKIKNEEKERAREEEKRRKEEEQAAREEAEAKKIGSRLKRIFGKMFKKS